MKKRANPVKADEFEPSGATLVLTRLARTVGRVLTLMSVIGILAACSGPSAPVPPRAASPERVTRVYLRAALTGDCGLTANLTTANTWSWCGDPKLLHYRSIGHAYFVPASEAGRNQECVDFNLYTDGSSDDSMPTGWQPWSLCFIRTHLGWRLWDQGQG
jgi:hypothetical protein